MEKLGLSQPLHDCNDTNHQADHVPESHFLGNNLGKMPKYQPPGNKHMSDLSDRVEFGSYLGPGLGKNWHFEKKSKR